MRANIPLHRLSVTVVGTAVALLLLVLAVLGWSSLRDFERVLQPEMEAKAQTIADTIATQVVRAVEAGVPLDRLRGFPEFAETLIADHQEVVHVALLDPAGRVLSATSGYTGPDAEEVHATSFPIDQRGSLLGNLSVGVDGGYVAQRLTEIQNEIIVILIVSLVLTFEVLLVVVSLSVSEPLRRLGALLARAERGVFSAVLPAESNDEIGRFARALNDLVRSQQDQYRRLMDTVAAMGSSAPVELRQTADSLRDRMEPVDDGSAARALVEARAADIRMPLFLFFFATELSRAFLPIFARDLYEPIPGLSYEMAIALPIAAYLFLVAVLTPMAGALTSRFGSRTLFLAGLVPTAIGLLMTVYAGNVLELTVWRGVNAIGFALTTIAALDYIAGTASPRTRAQGMAIYTAAFVTAGLCGTSIGGILADRMGFHATFMVATGITVLSALMLFVNLNNGKRRVGGGGGAMLTLADFGSVLVRFRFLILIVVAAIPTQLLTTGYLFYATPLLLDEAGYTTSVIGQVMMVYFIVMIALGLLMARAADSHGEYRLFAALGLMLAGLAALLPLLMEGSAQYALWIAASMGLVGFAHAMCIPAQGAILLEEADRAGLNRRAATISAYRVLERIGSVAGPILAALLAGIYGYGWTIAFLGLYVLACGLLFGLIWLIGGSGATRSAKEERA